MKRSSSRGHVRVIVIRPTFEFGGIKKYVETLCFHLAHRCPGVEFRLLLHPDWDLHWTPTLRHPRCSPHWSAQASNALDAVFPRRKNLFGLRGVARLTRPLNRTLRWVVRLPESDWHEYLARQLEAAKRPGDVVFWCQPGPPSHPPMKSTPLVVLWVDFCEDRSREYQEEFRRVGEEWLPVADTVVFLSATVEQRASQLYPRLDASRRRTILIPPWLPPVTERAILDMRQRLGLSDGQRVLLLPGRADERKGHLTLISAVSILRSKQIEGILPVFCGPGTEYFHKRIDPNRAFSVAYAEAVKRRVSALGWEWGREIVALGTVTDEDVHALYKLSAACVFPSVYEGLGLPILEAMCAGVPLVCSDIPVFREQLEVRGLRALMHPAGSAECLAESLHRVLRQEEDVSEMVRGNSAAIAERTWAQFSDDYLRLFEELADRPR